MANIFFWFYHLENINYLICYLPIFYRLLFPGGHISSGFLCSWNMDASFLVVLGGLTQ